LNIPPATVVYTPEPMSSTILAGCRILVVDDQPPIRELIRRGLEDAGAEVFEAEGGDAAGVAGREEPMLVLLDLAMPDRTGWEVLDDLRAAAATSRVPVVLQTSANDLPSFQTARRRGVAAFISKPFRLRDLVETCRRVLLGARPLQGVEAPTGALPLIVVRVDGEELDAHLLDRTEEGASLEMDRALVPGTDVVIEFARGDVRRAEVRWLATEAGRMHHGVSFRN
jgi:CheY-like chemotaxis protein